VLGRAFIHSNCVATNSARKVAVAGATGRTGSLVVKKLLEQEDAPQVIALVRDLEKAKDMLPMTDKLSIVQTDLCSESSIAKAVEGCDSAIWCATGFSGGNNQNDNIIVKMKKLFDLKFNQRKSIDIVAVPALAKALKSNTSSTPTFVMCSSAGVTRPSWDEKKKERLAGCADIPIVRLNPFGILDLKAESEELLRQSCANYCIVRPTGLNEDWSVGLRPIFSQGDVAVGRINRADVADVLVKALNSKESVGKTFEVMTLGGYAPPASIDKALSRLKTDEEGLSEDLVQLNYSLMQQLIPGEKQDAAALAMGQTYEQLDRGEEGRLGKRGEENVEQRAASGDSSVIRRT